MNTNRRKLYEAAASGAIAALTWSAYRVAVALTGGPPITPDLAAEVTALAILFAVLHVFAPRA